MCQDILIISVLMMGTAGEMKSCSCSINPDCPFTGDSQRICEKKPVLVSSCQSRFFLLSGSLRTLLLSGNGFAWCLFWWLTSPVSLATACLSVYLVRRMWKVSFQPRIILFLKPDSKDYPLLFWEIILLLKQAHHPLIHFQTLLGNLG